MGADVTRFARGFRNGCTSSTAMISRTSSRRTWSSTRARAGRRPVRTTWRWRCRRANPATTRIRIGCVHGCTFDMDGYQTNFPICRDAGVQRGLDYLAIGDTHSFRDVTETSPVPTVYPGAPEPTNFDEPGAGSVALVALFRHGMRPRVEAEPVGVLAMDRRAVPRHERAAHAADHAGPRSPCRPAAARHDRVPVGGERGRADPARPAGNRRHARPRRRPAGGPHEPAVAAGSDGIFPDDLPPVVKDTIARLDRLIADANDEAEKLRATRALAHLYKLLQSHEALSGAAR